MSALTDRVNAHTSAFEKSVDSVSGSDVLYHGSPNRYRYLKGAEGFGDGTAIFATPNPKIARFYASQHKKVDKGFTHLPISRSTGGWMHEVRDPSFAHISTTSGAHYYSPKKFIPVSKSYRSTYTHKEIPITQNEALAGGAVLALAGGTYYGYRHREDIKRAFHNTREKLSL